MSRQWILYGYFYAFGRILYVKTPRASIFQEPWEPSILFWFFVCFFFIFFAFPAACCSKSTASEPHAIIKLGFTHLFFDEFSHFPSLGACCSAVARALS